MRVNVGLEGRSQVKVLVRITRSKEGHANLLCFSDKYPISDRGQLPRLDVAKRLVESRLDSYVVCIQKEVR